MSESTLTPFIKWSDFTSRDKNKPDILDCKVLEIEKFDTKYSTNIRVLNKENNEYVEKILKLRSIDSDNIELERLWDKAVKENKVKIGRQFKIYTYLDKSKKNSSREIRRYQLEFL